MNIAVFDTFWKAYTAFFDGFVIGDFLMRFEEDMKLSVDDFYLYQNFTTTCHEEDQIREDFALVYGYGIYRDDKTQKVCVYEL